MLQMSYSDNESYKLGSLIDMNIADQSVHKKRQTLRLMLLGKNIKALWMRQKTAVPSFIWCILFFYI